MAAPLKPVDLTNYLAQASEAEIEALRFFGPRTPKVIFDIGACEGEDSIRYSRRFPDARVFTFEPLPANQALIRANFDLHRAATAELVPLALSDRIGEAEFFVSSGRPPDEFAGSNWNYGNKSSSLLPPASTAPMFGWIEFKERIAVRTQTLDAFCAERAIEAIDFIHMDVQGAEHLVLAGARTMLSRVGALWLEVANETVYAGQRLRPEMEQFMNDAGFALGFAINRGVEGDQFYVNRRHPRARAYLAGRRLEALTRRVRASLGRLRHRLLG